MAKLNHNSQRHSDLGMKHAPTEIVILQLKKKVQTNMFTSFKYMIFFEICKKLTHCHFVDNKTFIILYIKVFLTYFGRA